MSKYVTNNFVFNEPDFDLNNIFKYKKQLIFIDKGINKNECGNYIPCLIYLNKETQNFLIYFHGNSEDIFQSELIGSYFKSYLNMNVIIVEYPGYSIYNLDKKGQNQLFDDSLKVFNWIISFFKVEASNIFLCGRSLGTCVAINLASKINPKAIFLISPFKSLKNVGNQKWYSLFLEDIFNSEDYIKNVKCHILFIHGKKDNLVSYSNSYELLQICDQSKTEIKTPENMEHNKFDLMNDIIKNIKDFIDKYSLCTSDNTLKISKESLDKLFIFPMPISNWIESELFDLNKFSILKEIKIPNKNAYYLLNLIDGRFAATFNSSIILYNQRYYSIENEINIHKGIIYHISQMKNGYLISSSDVGEIIFTEIELNPKIIKILNEDCKVFKTIELKNGLVCSCTQKEIFLMEIKNFSKLINIKNSNEDINFLEGFTDDIIIFASSKKKKLNIYSIKNKNNSFKLKNEKEIVNVDVSYSNYNMNISDNKILIGGEKKIQYLDKEYNYNEENDFEINFNIKYITKINDDILLLGCKNYIIQYNQKNKKKILLPVKEEIYSILIQQINKFLITNTESIIIYYISQNDNNKNCNLI